MEAKDLMFFNKEGYQTNLRYNEEFNYWNGSMYFDKNSTDTFKTLGIYTFEKIQPSNKTFDASLDQYQLFNYDGIHANKALYKDYIDITDIRKSNENASFFTKWIYGDNIGRKIPVGKWVYFEGLTSYQSTDFDTTIVGEYQLYQVISSEQNRILIKTNIANNILLTPFAIVGAKIYSVDIIEYDDFSSLYLSDYTNKIYSGKKIYLISDSTENNGVHTIVDKATIRNRYKETYADNIFIPSAGDYIKLNITFFSDRVQISNGLTEFAPTLNTNGIQLPYIPKYLKIGDIIVAQEKNTSFAFAGNTSTFTITDIDRVNNIIEVDLFASLTNEIIDCYIYFASNVFTITQDIVLDNNNTYSLAVSYWSIVQQYKEILKQYGINLSYNTSTNSLVLNELYCGNNYFESEIVAYDSTNTIISTYNPIATNIPVYLHYVENIDTDEIIEANTIKYKRTFVFQSIDSNGLNIIINSKLYDVDFDTDINSTVTDWYSQYISEFIGLGINVTLSTTNTLNDTITIEPDYENRSIETGIKMGDFSQYYILDKDYEFYNIKDQLLITINDINYIVPFDTDDATTVTNWYNTYNGLLKTRGVIVFNPSSSLLSFNKIDPNFEINITYNLGYIPKSGDDSVILTKHSTNNVFSLISGNEIKVNTGTYNFFNFYSAGQKITISGSNKSPQNISYNIVDLTEDTLFLSYQGPFWQLVGSPILEINIVSSFFIRYPRNGFSDVNNRSKMRWTWKDTQIDEIFLYDFSGTQLTPIYNGFPDYTGPMPLCGSDGTLEVSLNKLPNDKIEHIANPKKQQTIFDKLEFDNLFNDEEQDPNVDVAPMQVFIGYNQKIESWVKSRLYLELIEDLTFNLTTDSNLSDNLWVITSNSIEVTSPLTNFNFVQLGFQKGQILEINSYDFNADGKKLALLENNGRNIRILSVNAHKITFTSDDLIPETSVKTVAKSTPPYYDNNGNAYTENRVLNVSLTIKPQLLAYFDIYGESEDEDERHKINLDNRNLNILQLKDFYIFKEVDIKESGIDWIILNRKRKELLEIYSEIFNNVSSYKSIIQAINFFGYNDLTFTEYFQNINPDSPKFGKLFNMDLLGIFDKTQKGWSYSNLAIENLKNNGFKKTNLFSLNYKITDSDGNFIDAYSQEEVKIKLNGLKRWLTENLIPIGAKILDINGKYTMPYNWYIKHETYQSKNFRIEEYSNPIDFTVEGYLQPVNTGSDNYNITVHPTCYGNVEWYDYRIRTFSLPEWNDLSFYLAGEKIYHNGYIYEADTNIQAGEEPGISNNWSISSIDKLQCVQIISDVRHDLSPWTFTINKLIDPHFIVEVNWHSSYGCTLLLRKAYSAINGFFDNFNI